MVNEVKMIVTDLDGTLLRADSTVSEHTKTILTRCREAGIKIVCATGRGGSADKLAPAELFDGRALMNGAAAYVGAEMVYSRIIPHQTARPILLACDRHGLKIAAERGEMHYANFPLSDAWPSIPYRALADFLGREMDAEKLNMIVEDAKDTAFIEKLLPEQLYLIATNDGLVQVMHKEATKAKAVAELAAIWGIAPAQIVAFGDDLNDIDMLMYAGVGVAMENAQSAVKAAADVIGFHHDADGVAAWIKANVAYQ